MVSATPIDPYTVISRTDSHPSWQIIVGGCLGHVPPSLVRLRCYKECD
jgi:hypothetical protein